MSITHEANVPSAEPTTHDVAPDPRSVEAALGAPATQFGVAPINRLLSALQTADSVDHVAVALEESIELIGGAQSVMLDDEVAGFSGPALTIEIEANGENLGRIVLGDAVAPAQLDALRQVASVAAPYLLLFQHRDELDVSRQQLFEADRRHRNMIETDELTGLNSRVAMEQTYRSTTRDRIDHVFAVARVVGLDQVGGADSAVQPDLVLRDVARHLQRSLGELAATISHVGRGEFALLFPGRSLRQVQSACSALIARLKVQSEIQVGNSPVRVAIGLSDGRDGDTWQNARDASTVAADGVGDAIRVFDPRGPETSRVRADREWIQRLPQTLGGDELALFGQAILQMSDEGDTVHAYEVLLRGFQGLNQPFSAMDFVETAMRVGREVELDLWVVEQAVQLLQQDPSVRLSVNLCPRTMVNPAAVDGVLARLDAVGVTDGRLIVEITEHESIRSPKDLRRSIETMRDHGVAIALDDLGAGWTSLDYLRDCPLDYVKIDGRWISRVLADPIAEAAVDSMLEASQAVGAKVVAQWIESAAVRSRLIEKGFEFGQGFHLHIPHPLANLVADRSSIDRNGAETW